MRLLLICCSMAVASAQNLVIDGVLDDAFWKGVPAQALIPSGPGVPKETAGEVRVAVRGRYLCVAARMPEPGGRVTARLTGVNPSWEDEDLLRVVAGADIGYTDRMVTVNPLGAYSIEKALHAPSGVLDVYPYSVERQAQTVWYNASRFLVAARAGEREWTAELAIPLNELSAPGNDRILASVERVRAMRPGCPRQRWHWPEQGPAARIPGTSAVTWDDPPPAFRPPLAGNREAPLRIGRVNSLPAPNAPWDDPAWHSAPSWPLLRDGPDALAPRHSTEVKAVHDGRSIAILARCAEPGQTVAKVKENGGAVGRDDSFHVYLSSTGSTYAQLVVNAAGYLLDAAGFSGGERLSRARNWASNARVSARAQAGYWTVRMDIPLQEAAGVLGEAGLPPAWRVLFLRYRPERGGEAPEKSVLPVIESDTALCPARYRRMVLVEDDPAALPHADRPVPSGFAAFDSRVLPDMPLGGMLEAQVRGRVRAALDAERKAWDAVNSRADWERFRDVRVKALAASIGPFPDRTPLETRVTNRFAGRGYRREDLVFRSRPGLWVTADLYLPEKRAARMPAIVIVHSHHRPRTQAELQDMGILWARAGCAVLVMDQIGHGERIQNYPWNREPYHSRYIMGMQLYLAGESLLKWMVWDVMRGIDLLTARPDVDPARIVVLGSVAAGGEPAAVTAALDSRVAAVAPFNFGRVDPMFGEWESTRCLRRSLADQFFPWLIGASVAPRHYIYSMEMGWESYRAHPAWDRYKKVFGFYGVPDNLDEAHGFGTFPGPGECSNIGPAQRKTLYPELERWFGIPAPAAEPDDRRPEKELAALTPAVASELKMRSIHELARETAERKLKAARAQTGVSLRQRLAPQLGDIEPPARMSASVRWTRPFAGAVVEGITVEPEPGITVPLLLLRPERINGRPPVVAAVAQGGKELFLQMRGAEIAALLKRGAAVCLVDVRGTGESAPEDRRGRNSEENSLAATEFMLGNTLLGARLKDFRTVLGYLAERGDLDPRRITAWGDSFSPPNPPRLALDEITGWQMGPEIQHQAEPLGGLLALLAALYDDRVRAVAARGTLASYLSVLDDQFAYVPNDVILPGILEAGDIPDIASALAPRPVLLDRSVDGRNRLVKQGQSDGFAEWLAAQAASAR